MIATSLLSSTHTPTIFDAARLPCPSAILEARVRTTARLNSAALTDVDERAHLLTIAHKIDVFEETGRAGPEHVYTVICTELHRQGLLRFA